VRLVRACSRHPSCSSLLIGMAATAGAGAGASAGPRGVPSVTSRRSISAATGVNDIINDGNTISVLQTGEPTTRHEVAQVLDRSLTELEVCERTFGSQAGLGLGAALNPISACVHDCANVCLLFTGSKLTKKSIFFKRVVCPFVCSELFACLNDKEQEAKFEFYQYQITVKCFEIQDEVRVHGNTCPSTVYIKM
jgi:hypothetical protein